MIYYILAGLGIGIVSGLNLKLAYNPDYVVYITVTTIAILNSILSIINQSMNADLSIKKAIKIIIGDLIFAFVFTYIGERLGLPIYLVAIFAFGNNIYKNYTSLINLW